MMIGSRPQDLVYARSIKPIRNQMRKYEYSSLLDAFLRYLNAPTSTDRLADQTRLPWVVERLVLWLLADSEREYGARLVNETDVRRLINLAWNSADKGYAGGKAIQEIGLFVRQAMLPQFPYQQSLDTHAYALQLYLLRKLPEGSKLRVFLDERAGMPIQAYLDLAVLYWIHSTTEKPWFSEGFMNSLADVFPLAQQLTFLNSFTFQANTLKEMCRCRSIQVDEWFQPTYFYRTPCVWHHGAAVPFGRPTLRRHFQALINDWIAEADRDDLRQNYDRLVESYVRETLSRAKAKFIDESDLRRLIPSGKVCDFLVEEPEGVILFEVKNKGLSRAVPASRDPLELAARLKATIVKARTQLANTETALRLMPQYREKAFFRVIVTSDDLWISHAEWLLGNEEESHTWLLSLRELDILAKTVEVKQNSMTNVFTQFEVSQVDVVSATFSVGAFIERLDKLSKDPPKHLLEEMDAALERIRSRLPQEDVE